MGCRTFKELSGCPSSPAAMIMSPLSNSLAGCRAACTDAGVIDMVPSTAVAIFNGAGGVNNFTAGGQHALGGVSTPAASFFSPPSAIRANVKSPNR